MERAKADIAEIPSISDRGDELSGSLGAGSRDIDEWRGGVVAGDPDYSGFAHAGDGGREANGEGDIGLEPLVRPEVPALTPARLAWVQQNYIRAETLIRANARLVKAQSDIPLTKEWGGAEVASADGLRFVVPVRTLYAGYNSKYFHVERGVTYYNFTSNQFSGFHGIVIPGPLQGS